jgi:heme/copper-type cytochrome/quinol oxidase subunit 2
MQLVTDNTLLPSGMLCCPSPHSCEGLALPSQDDAGMVPMMMMMMMMMMVVVVVVMMMVVVTSTN